MSNRSRLLNAVICFATNTQHCGKIKLFKLLYLMDFEHFCQTGKSVTGYDYQAWKFGPVPIDLMEEWEELGSDLAAVVHIAEEVVIDYERQTVKVNPGVQFDDDEFSPRQLAIMQALATKYRDAYSPKMIDVTHEQNGAWSAVWQDGAGAHRLIPYELAIPSHLPQRDALLEIAQQQTMYQAALQASRWSASA